MRAKAQVSDTPHWNGQSDGQAIPAGSVRRRRSWWMARVWVLLVVMQALLAASKVQGFNVRMPMIVVVKSDDHLRKLREMCLETMDDNNKSVSLFHGVPHDCHIAGACKRVFTASIKGVFGDFTNEELDTIERCLKEGVKYIEPDGAVSRTGNGYSEAAHPLSLLDIQKSGPKYVNTGRYQFILRGETSKTARRVHAFDVSQDATNQSQTDRLVAGVNESTLAQISQSHGIKIQSVPAALWNLDRVDQRELPLDKAFRYGAPNAVGTGNGVSVFILDSGIRPSHQEFSEWMTGETRGKYGYDFVEDDPISEDCFGHGTHVASIAVGRGVGIARQAHVVSVRVLNCLGRGNISTMVAGLDWVANHHKKPGVVTLSLGVDIGIWSRTLEDTVRSLIEDHGLTVVVASGNDAVDSCNIAPANVAEAITVAGSDLATKFGESTTGEMEGIYHLSNTGRCVDIFAPGVDVYAACGGYDLCSEVTDSSYGWSSGTSMAAPHVAGVAAIYLGEFPNASPAEVKEAIITRATKDKIDGRLLLPGTPNRLLYANLFEG